MHSIRPVLSDQTRWIVIDGGSTDGTLEVINNNLSIISYWKSALDHGIYDAMNQGAAVADRSHLLFLNAGDTLNAEVFDSVLSQVSRKPSSIHCFSHYEVMADSSIRYNKPYPGLLTTVMSICHQSTVIPSLVHQRLFGYNTDYTLAADYDFFLRAYLLGVDYVTSDLPLSYFFRGGISDRKLISSRLQAIHSLWNNDSPRKIVGTYRYLQQIFLSSFTS
jgi:glycosyltransferase involved in cell wall biosynthesis